MSVTTARGFVAAGVASGIKQSGDLDVALVATDDNKPVAAAGVFTQNKVAAAPVRISRLHLQATAGHAAAVILNAGNANAATGAAGESHAAAMCDAVASQLGCTPDEVLVCSTGLIGIPLPVDLVTDAVPALVAGLSPDHGVDAAEAIRTTDSVRKEVVVNAGTFTVGGMAKGAAMLQPNMATMLAVLTTDAEATPEMLAVALEKGVARSFNALSVDGCTSTNDTVLLLASGRAGPVDGEALEQAVASACQSLAGQMAGDAEGATKVVTITVRGAATDAEADVAARAVANSVLCKCSWYGCDPYWGRVASELGASGVSLEADRLRISYGGVVVADGGVACDHDVAAVAAHMAGRDLAIECDLHMGPGEAVVITNDLTHAYVDENMGTS
jgi:glutamate N-acetyltransferase/amino-acid N-acetyltransferase